MMADAVCWQVTPNGDTDPGECIEVVEAVSAKQAAQLAAECFDDIEGGGFDRRHGSVHHVEVDWPGKPPRRFVVRCEVLCRYEAEEVGA
jgi:hypothetical protein